MAILAFSLFHVLPSTPLRNGLIRRYGRPAFMWGYSVVSFLLFVWLWWAFFQAEPEEVYWVTDRTFRLVSAGVMFFAFQFLIIGTLQKRPVLLTAETLLANPTAIRGILRITRHPLLWALALWAGTHVANNGDPAGLLLFGYFTVLAVGGTVLIDFRRKRLLPPEAWAELTHKTSNLPFLAILRGRNRLGPALREIGWWRPLLATALWAAVLHGHAALFGPPIF